MRLPELTRPEAIATLNELAAAWPELVWPADAPARLPDSRHRRGPGRGAGRSALYAWMSCGVIRTFNWTLIVQRILRDQLRATARGAVGAREVGRAGWGTLSVKAEVAAC